MFNLPEKSAAGVPTPAAGYKSFFHNAADGKLSSKDDGGSVAPVGEGEAMLSASFTYSDWLAAPGSATQRHLTVGQLPAGAIPTYVKIKHSSAMAGGANTTVQTQIVSTDESEVWSSGLELTAATGADRGLFQPLGSNARIPDHSAPSNLRIRLTADDDIADLTAGAYQVWVWYKI